MENDDEIDGKKLRIDGVINKTYEKTVEVLYAEYIDEAEADTILALQNIFNANEISPNTDSLISSIEDTLSLSGSKKFYQNATATAQIGNMRNISANLAKLKELVNSLDVETIKKLISQYNEALTELKTDCRKKVLEAAADKYNAEKHPKDGYPIHHEKEQRHGFPSANYYDFTNIVKGEPKNLTTKMSNDGSSTLECTYDWYEYKIIEYWSWIKDIHWFTDPGFEEVENNFAKVGAELPYVKEAIVYPPGEN